MNDRVDEYFARLRGKHALVLGIGVSNRPLIRMLLGYGIAVTACDRTPRESSTRRCWSWSGWVRGCTPARIISTA